MPGAAANLDLPHRRDADATGSAPGMTEPDYREDPSEEQPPGGAQWAERPGEPSAADGVKVHIAGAGTFLMAILLVSLSVLFLAPVIAYLVIRHQAVQAPPHTWPPPGLPHVPQTLWISTAVILCASVTIQGAIKAVRRDDQPGLRRNLLFTLVIGAVFLLMQALNWAEFFVAIERTVLSGAYLGMFFVLTGLHAAHVIGGLVPLAIVYARAKRGRYSPNYYPGVRYAAAYWHFLDVIWVLLFLVIMF